MLKTQTGFPVAGSADRETEYKKRTPEAGKAWRGAFFVLESICAARKNTGNPSRVWRGKVPGARRVRATGVVPGIAGTRCRVSHD